MASPITIPHPSSTAKSSLPHVTTTSPSARTNYPLHHAPRPGSSRTVSSPPQSPMQRRGTSIQVPEATMLHDSGAMTPPLSPSSTRASIETGRTSIDSLIAPSEVLETRMFTFDYSLSDYEITASKPLGSGLWSDVYLARPCIPKLNASQGSMPTPPSTPVKHHSSHSKYLPPIPRSYAIKVPASRSAKAVLETEAIVLSQLSRFPDSSLHTVPFYGLDARTGALVMEALPQTLESYVLSDLNSLSEPDRARKLGSIFPSLALNLLNGLEWLESRECIHADIKPSNFLISISTSNSTTSLKAVYTDFSSALVPTATAETSSPKPKTPLGGGTWDFLDPSLLKSSPASGSSFSPSRATDLYALALTLLYTIIGCSPFDSTSRNVYRRREMVRHGRPLGYAASGDDGSRNEQRLNSLEREIGVPVTAWLGEVLEREAGKRPESAAWRASLERGLSRRR